MQNTNHVQPFNWQTALRRWPLLLLFGVLFSLAQPFDLTFTASDVAEAEFNVASRYEGSNLRRAGLLGLAAFSMIALLMRSENRLQISGLGWIILLFAGWALLSIGWSVEPAITMRKVVVLGILLSAALAAARMFSLDEILLLVAINAGLAVTLGIASEAALGTFAPWRADYRFAGVMFPAFSAWTASLLLLAGLGLCKRMPHVHWWVICTCLLAAVIVVLAKTRASAAACVVALSAFACLAWPHRRMVRGLIFAGFGLAAGLLVLEVATTTSSEALFAALNLGRETESLANLTGRIDIWHDLAPYISARPLIGYGYETFWTEQQLETFAARHGWAVPDSHNGFIELTLGVGIVGAALFALIVLVGVRNAWASYCVSGHPTYAVAMGALVLVLVNAMSVATQLAPYLSTFLTLVLIMRLAFVPRTAECRTGRSERLLPFDHAPRWSQS